MKLLFIQGGSRWKFDSQGNVYTDANFNENIWNRYRKYCDELTVLLRCETQIYSPEEAMQKFNIFDASKSTYETMPDLYRPIDNFFKPSIRKQIKHTIENAVKKADKVIIRSVSDIYTNLAVYYAQKYNKPYLIEVTTFIYESLWYHSLKGKFIARYQENKCKKAVYESKYAVYVTEEALQKRYPCKGKVLGCSDVELEVMNDEILQRRLKKIKENNGKLVIGTAAFLDVGWKGQKYVIMALNNLKQKGITNIEYQLIGAGTGHDLQNLVDTLGMQEQVKQIGAMPHDQVSGWLDSIDIYIQPSFQEGLCRALLEAMSRGCPAIATDVGGNYELLSKEYLVQPKNHNQIAEVLLKLSNDVMLEKCAKANYVTAKKYETTRLDRMRDKFYMQFMLEGN